MCSCRIHLNDVQALILLQTLLQLLFRKAFSQNHGLHELEFDPQRPGGRGVIADDVEDAGGDVLPAPLAFAGRAGGISLSLIMVCQARFAHMRQANRLVHIFPRHVIRKPQPRQPLTQPQNRKQLTCRHDSLITILLRASLRPLRPQTHVGLDNVRSDILGHERLMPSRSRNVLTQQARGHHQRFDLLFFLLVIVAKLVIVVRIFVHGDSIHLRLFVRSATVHSLVLVDECHVPRQCHVPIHIGHIQYQKH
mmetsp:Transcript_21998/g.39283  ORF Transcript_21998/g.39283 Transcript_21998/m.39283 type:complete len:251 (-) Transcript_21998:248-1000(-)